MKKTNQPPTTIKNARELREICSRTDLSAQELYRAIAGDQVIHAEIMRVSRDIAEHIDTPAKALTILGVNTIKNIVLKISEEQNNLT